MKLIIKLILSISLYFFMYSNINFVLAETNWIKIKVTEKIPWAICDEGDVNNKIYNCTIEKWFWSITKMMWTIIKYFTYIIWLWWVLYFVINWIIYSMWWIEASLKDKAKERIIWVIIWLILLFLSWVILNIIAPWIYWW